MSDYPPFDTPLTLPDGTMTTWGEATAEQHEAIAAHHEAEAARAVREIEAIRALIRSKGGTPA